jgi:molecular chaperone DnaK
MYQSQAQAAQGAPGAEAGAEAGAGAGPAGGPGAGQPRADEDVVEADYEIVDEEK